MRFSLVHPQWRPPGHSSKFLGHLRGRVQQDAAAWGASSLRSPPAPGILSTSPSPLVSRSQVCLSAFLSPPPFASPLYEPAYWCRLLSCLPGPPPSPLSSFLTLSPLAPSRRPSWPTSWCSPSGRLKTSALQPPARPQPRLASWLPFPELPRTQGEGWGPEMPGARGGADPPGEGALELGEVVMWKGS